MFSCVTCVKVEDTLCCIPGLYLHQDESGAFSCWDAEIKNDTYIEYELVCTSDIEFVSEDDKTSFSVRDDGYLLVNVPNDQIEIKPKT